MSEITDGRRQDTNGFSADRGVLVIDPGEPICRDLAAERDGPAARFEELDEPAGFLRPSRLEGLGGPFAGELEAALDDCCLRFKIGRAHVCTPVTWPARMPHTDC